MILDTTGLYAMRPIRITHVRTFTAILECPAQDKSNSVGGETRRPITRLRAPEVRGHAKGHVESKVTKRSERVVTREISS
jgi:hypothetical protein